MRWWVVTLAIGIPSFGGCARITMAVDQRPLSCRTPSSVPVGWISPDDLREREKLSAWCAAVGPVTYYEPPRHSSPAFDALTIVSWNVGVGRGRIVDFVNDTRRENPDSALVLLIQEAYRADDVPVDCAPGSRRAKRIAHARRSEDIAAAARALGMYAAYAPSMRNGEDCRAEPREDRGNAILSTLPLSELAAIELPVARQRRVAITASVHAGGRELALASVHLDTAPFAHRRQANALAGGLRALGTGRVWIVGGDFNGPLVDPGVLATRKHLLDVPCGEEPTHDFPALRLDHLFVSRDVLLASCITGSKSYGSDHWPLIARVGL